MTIPYEPCAPASRRRVGARSTARHCLLALLAGVASVAGGGSAAGADRVILGDSLVVRNPDGVEQRRTLVGVGKERATDVPGVSDPTVGGAVLMIALDGGTPSMQSYELDAGGWAAAGSSGYRYVGPTGVDGDPVRKVVLQRRANGTALLKVSLRGSLGTQQLDVVPPNPGATGLFVLDVAGGDRYCSALGGAAGGTVRRDEAKVGGSSVPRRKSLVRLRRARRPPARRAPARRSRGYAATASSSSPRSASRARPGGARQFLRSSAARSAGRPSAGAASSRARPSSSWARSRRRAVTAPSACRSARRAASTSASVRPSSTDGFLAASGGSAGADAMTRERHVRWRSARRGC
jgi:hypothetical protein